MHSLLHVPSDAIGPARAMSVFAGLLGFTPFSESRDPGEVRGMLTGYFDRARDVVDRFGGTVEESIGDAVMAVWGAREAREDAAEPGVRAALGKLEQAEAGFRRAAELMEDLAFRYDTAITLAARVRRTRRSGGTRSPSTPPAGKGNGPAGSRP